MSFDQILDKNLLTRLERDDPINVEVSYTEYRNHLLPQVLAMWKQPWGWNQASYQRLLLFFRGYSFFRELGENEREFWANLHQELQFQSTLKNAHRDLLERALKSDTRIKDLFVQDDRREFVKTIDAIWGIRSLNAKTLEKLFRRYYFQVIQFEMTPELIRKLLSNASPEEIERTVRQSASYNRIFSGLRSAIEFILKHRVDTAHLETLSQRLHEAGFVFSDPNPIEFFRNKAEKALRTLLVQLRGELKIVEAKPKLIRIKEETDEDDVLRPKRTREEFQIEVQYSDNTYEFGNQVKLEFSDLPTGTRVLVLSGATEKKISFEGNHVAFYLNPGETLAQVLVANELAAREKRLFCLPELNWFFYDHRGEKLSHRPLEGRFLIAEVRVKEDGRYARKRWTARWDSMGEIALEFPLEFDLDELRIEVKLRTEPYGIRFFGADHQVLEELHHQVLQFQMLPVHLSPQHRVLYASQPDKTVALEEWQTLRPEIEDELIVERNLHKDWWEAVGRLPVQLEPVLHCCELRGVVLELYAFAPIGATWRIIENNDFEHCHDVSLESQQIAVRHPDRFLRREVIVRLECGVYNFETRFEYQPNLQEWLESELPFGIAWGHL